IETGALEPRGGTEPFAPPDVGRIRVLRAWEEAGLPPEAVISVVREGELSISWLDSPALGPGVRSDITYDELNAKEGVPLTLIQGLYEALGFAPPGHDYRVREGDRELAGLVRTFEEAGGREGPTLRLLRIYADSMRRVAKAEAELYESEIEQPLRQSGRGERELMEFGAQFGERIIGFLERALLEIYHRHRQHVWIEHSINHAEVALERAGLYKKVPRPPAISFVDLTGYTRLTEQRGDELAAQLASSLGSLVEEISRTHRGRPIRWLGDGGLLHFKAPRDAVLSALDMVEKAPGVGLPPVHIGIHTGPVVFQDGDVFGRTVNIASRIASYATGGQVLVSEETAHNSPDGGVRFEPIEPVSLKGIENPLTLYRAFRARMA
ncbi:MAG: adenylate/guanylate cyclase domain-containing protein, partial [Actinomycetota bacterium]|nr:adenylate/guanylate cyclase domain-containing protein [Actinomycetota bacterium]